MIIGLGTISIEIHSVIDDSLSAGHTHICSQASPSPAGSVFIQIIAAARSGAKTAICGRVGNDLFGEYALKILTREGITKSSLIKDDTYKTPLSISISDSAQTTFIAPAEQRFDYDAQISQNALNYRTILLLQSHNTKQDLSALVTRARSAGAKIIMTTQHFESLPKEFEDVCDYVLSQGANEGYTYLCRNQHTEREIIISADLHQDKMIRKIGFDVFCGSFAAGIQAQFSFEEAIAHALNMVHRIKDTASTYDAIPYLED